MKSAVSLALALLLLSAAAGRAQEVARVTLVHLNDIAQIDQDQGRGGLARLASVISDERAGGRQALVTHGGGALSPSPLSAIDRGSHMIRLLNILPVDMFGVGGHDFDFGPAALAERAREASFPMLASNITTAAGATLDGAGTVAIRSIGGFRLGFMSLLSPSAAQLYRTSGLRIAPLAASARRIAAELRAQGADMVIALASVDDAEAVALFRLGVLDLVLRGDSADLQIMQNDRTLLATSSPGGGRVVAIDLRLERSAVEAAPEIDDTADDDREISLSGTVRRDVRWSAAARTIDTAGAPTDYLMLGLVQQTLFLHATATEEVLARLPAALDTREALLRRQGGAFPEYVADAIRVATGADFALVHAGNFPGDRVYPAGSEFRRGDLLRELPFRNRVVMLDVSGADIIAALENGFSLIEQQDGRFPQVSGMVIDFDAGAPPGQRVMTVSGPDGPVLPGRRYRLATSDFLADGLDGYAAFAGRPRLGDSTNSPTLADVVTRHMRHAGPPQPGAPRLRQR